MEECLPRTDVVFYEAQFLVRQPRSGRIPVEKMDLMNTVNQLLLEMNKLKGDKVALEEEIKTQRRCQVRDRVKRTVTARDVAMAASNKVPPPTASLLEPLPIVTNHYGHMTKPSV